MITNKSTLSSFVFGIFFGDSAKHADAFVADILKNLSFAEQMGARAKSATFKCRSNRPTYERYLKQPETKRRRASINKQQALRANFYSACQLGENAVDNIIAASQELVKLLPAMMHDSKYNNPSSNDRLGRSSNCVLVSRFLTGLPEYVAQLRRSWKIDEKDLGDLAHGYGDFFSLTDKATERDHKHDHLFCEPLDIIFVRGTNEKVSDGLEKHLDALNSLMQRANELLQAFADAKSRYLNDEQFKARIAETTGPDDSKLVLDAYNAAMLDCEHLELALTLVSDELIGTLLDTEKALNAGKSTFMSFNVARQSNLLHLRIRMTAASNIMRAARAAIDTMRGDRRPYHAREAAFGAIPAVFQMPSRANR